MKVLQWIKHTVTRVLLLYIAAPLGRLSGRQVIHVLHVGKTGGTAVKAAFDAYPLLMRFEPGRLLLFHNHSVSIRHVPRGERVVVFLRDPVTRFVSGFNSRLRRGRPRRFVPWSRGERRAFRHFESPEALARALGATDLHRRREAERAMRSIEHVRSFQADWLGKSLEAFKRRSSDILLLGYQETLGADFNRLKGMLGLGAEVDLPASPEAAHRSPEGGAGALSEEAVANLRRWYRKDYELLSCIEGMPHGSHERFDYQTDCR